jgi:hypothetical protein
MLGGSAVGYVLQKNELHELGRAITRREAVLERLKWDNKMYAQHLANLQLPQNIADRARKQNLGLAQPQPGQTIWLPEPGTEPVARSTQVTVVDIGSTNGGK